MKATQSEGHIFLFGKAVLCQIFNSISSETHMPYFIWIACAAQVAKANWLHKPNRPWFKIRTCRLAGWSSSAGSAGGTGETAEEAFAENLHNSFAKASLTCCRRSGNSSNLLRAAICWSPFKFLIVRVTAALATGESTWSSSAGLQRLHRGPDAGLAGALPCPKIHTRPSSVPAHLRGMVWESGLRKCSEDV